MRREAASARAFTLFEMLCVLAIIALLVGLLLGPISKGYSRAKRLQKSIGEGQTNIIKMEEKGGLLSPD